MVNNIQLIWQLAWMLRTYRTCDLTLRFSKYEFYNKLLGDVTLFRVTQGVTLNNVTPLNICNWMRNFTNLPLDYVIFVYSPYLQNFNVIKG